MLLPTPFHDRVAAANQTSLWSHWSGHLVVDKYQMSEKWEYVALRNAAGMFDTSPLYKYRVHGPHAERFLAGVLTRDIRRCEVGQAQYTIWCDDRGFVNEDGVVLRTDTSDYFLTTAEPNLAYFGNLASGYELEIDDVSDQYGILSVQGPRSALILSQVAPEVNALSFFEHTSAIINGAEVIISRTGFTGDLGYEVIVRTEDALGVWDSIVQVGEPHGLTLFGQTALLMARIEAGLLLIDVDFEPSRFAENDEHRSTPLELGLGWMLAGIDHDSRPFIGRRAILRERSDATSRWKMTGLEVDWAEYSQRYTAGNLIPPKDHTPVQENMMVYSDVLGQVGYATSFMYSPILQRHIALARIRPDVAVSGTKVNLEFTVNHRYEQIGAYVTPTPFFNPARKTAAAHTAALGDLS